MTKRIATGLVLILLSSIASLGSAIPEPTWTTTDPIFNPNSADHGIAAKDPSIVYVDGKYHLFYTLHVPSGKTEIDYACAPTLEGLNSAQRARVSGGSAPQVFSYHGLWYLISNGTNYATNATLGSTGWQAHGNLCKTMPKFAAPDGNGPIDPWVICDDTTAYLFYSRDNGTLNRTSEPLSVFPDPNQWSEHVVVIDERPDKTNIYEATHIYKSRADGQYYMQIEGKGTPGGKGTAQDRRKFALYTAAALGGKWTKVSNSWAVGSNLKFTGTPWTDQISHPEAIRSNYTQDMEVDDINHSYWIFMGTTQKELDAAYGPKGGYYQIPWHLGLMHDGDGPMFPASP